MLTGGSGCRIPYPSNVWGLLDLLLALVDDAQGHSVERVVSLWDPCEYWHGSWESSTGPYGNGNILTHSTALVLGEGGL